MFSTRDNAFPLTTKPAQVWLEKYLVLGLRCEHSFVLNPKMPNGIIHTYLFNIAEQPD